MATRLHAVEAPAAWQLPLVDVVRWIGKEPPKRRWIVEDWLARGTGALLVGEDGIGKSLVAQQLATSVAAGRPFLGLPTSQAPALYVTCEDDETELWRRQRAINRSLGLPIDSAPAMLSSLVGYTEVSLGWFDACGQFELSPAFHGIARTVQECGAGLVVLDNVAHLFSGNENARRDVATFCATLDRLAMSTDATVLCLAHPNKGGAEYSGSTGWSAHVRQRWYMERPDAAEHDRDARLIRKSKANYSVAGEELHFRWHEWAFSSDDDLPEDRRAEMAEVIKHSSDNGVFLACLDARARDGLIVSPNVSPNYAPTQFEAMPAAKGIGRDRLRRAMERLLVNGEIEVFDQEKKGKGVTVKALRRPSLNSPRTPARTAPERVPERLPNGPEQSSRTPPHTHLPPKGGIGAGPRASAPTTIPTPSEETTR